MNTVFYQFRSPSPPFMDHVAGVLASLSIYNEKWGHGKVRLDDGTTLRCVGEALVGLAEGNRYSMEGRIVHHAKYGKQISVAVATIDIPCSEDALIRHLQRNFKGCGEVTARKLVERHRDRLDLLRDTLVSNPLSLDFSTVTKRRVQAAGDLDLKSLIYRDLSTRVGAANIRHPVLRRVAEWLHALVAQSAEPVRDAWAVFSRNPYAPIRDVDGYAFAAADEIALRSIGFPRFHDARLAALATHALREGCERNGHTFLTLDDISDRIVAYDPDVSPDKAMAAAMANKEPIVLDKGRYYPRHLYHCETALANNLARRALRIAEPIRTLDEASLEHEIDMAERSLGEDFHLDDSQRKALKGILTSTHLTHTLTAGPGCGKTALMEILVHVVRDRKIAFCAPTGKAAKVLAARVMRFGLNASTIHSLLGVTEEGFTHNEDNPLEADIVVADESSMDDLALTRALIDALPPDCHIIFLGDTGQLPSVGPGQVLADLLALPGDHHRLEQPHRNDGGILDVVQQCGRGTVDCEDRPGVSFSRALPAPNDVGITRVVNAYLDAVEACGIDKVGLLMPRRKGDTQIPGWNTTYLNEVLRQTMNPEGERIPGTSLRVGDRIIIRKNLLLEQETAADGETRSEYVVNGDTGFVTRCVTDAAGTNVLFLRLELDDGREIRYPGKAVENLGLAYAMTVHAAQGSEYRQVIFICTNGSPAFVHRGILYTAFSRAREKLMVLGDHHTIRHICQRTALERNSLLVERTTVALRKMHRGGYR
jgi:exodeoxyribonuclease V alpha subunit